MVALGTQLLDITDYKKEEQIQNEASWWTNNRIAKGLGRGLEGLLDDLCKNIDF